jgi:hypothetical protein
MASSMMDVSARPRRPFFLNAKETTENEKMSLREQPDPTRFGLQRNGSYAPGPAEIKQRCAEIQSLWTAAERFRRIALAKPRQVTLQEFWARDF